jgi:hypothetical protein
VAYTDPFGLCPEPGDAACEAFKTGMSLLGGTAGFILGGGAGVLETAFSGGLAAPAAVLQTGAATATGLAWGAAAGELLSNIVFAKSHTVATTSVAGHGTVRVDWEEPAGDRAGNVHVQGKGKNALGKVILNTIDDLKNLPKAVRDNQTIQQGVKKAFDMLERFSQ